VSNYCGRKTARVTCHVTFHLRLNPWRTCHTRKKCILSRLFVSRIWQSSRHKTQKTKTLMIFQMWQKF